jgi:hypothetical protein
LYSAWEPEDPRLENRRSHWVVDVSDQNLVSSANQNAERLHGSAWPYILRSISVWISTMYSPVDVSRIQYMTLKQQRAARRQRAQKQITQQAVRKLATMAVSSAPKKKKRTPFADVGSIIGGGVGSMFGFPQAKGIGKWLGSGIGSIFGSGDYQVVGQNPSYNVLANGNQIPKFSTTRATNLVSHREYLGDITGTAAFTNRSYPLNPGSSITFPWLATIAQNYQQYKWHGLIFEFRPLITDFVTSGAPGVVVMATNYNADEPPYSTKQAMENSEYAVSVKPTCNLMHGVECATNQTVLSELYVRPGGIASNLDLKFTDLGNFQFASQGNPVQLLGELWVSYTVEFFKPVLPNDVGGNVQSITAMRSGVSNTAALGTVPVSSAGDLVNFAVTSPNTLQFTGQPGNLYLVQTVWSGSIAAAFVAPSIVFTNAELVPIYFNDSTSAVLLPPPATPATGAIDQITIRCTATSPSLITCTYSLGTYPSGTVSVDILVTQVSDNV